MFIVHVVRQFHRGVDGTWNRKVSMARKTVIRVNHLLEPPNQISSRARNKPAFDERRVNVSGANTKTLDDIKLL